MDRPASHVVLGNAVTVRMCSTVHLVRSHGSVLGTLNNRMATLVNCVAMNTINILLVLF